ANATAAGCLGNIRPRFSLGCPAASRAWLEEEAMVPLAAFILATLEAGNTAKELEVWLRLYPLCFQALIDFSTGQVLVFFGPPAGPIDDHAVNLLMRAHTEGNRQLRLRKIAGTAVHHARLCLPVIKDSNRGADSIAVGLGALQMQSNAFRMRCLIVAIEIGGPIVGGQQNVQVAVAIEISV